MKRRLFALLPFLGAAAGQDNQTTTQGTIFLGGQMRTVVKMCPLCSNFFETDAAFQAHQCRAKPKNGECPRCGKMAAPWKRPVHKAGSINREPLMQGDVVLSMVRTYPVDTPYGPTERQERCSRCNTSFWTDAEKD